jgi:hypothetical protein
VAPLRWQRLRSTSHIAQLCSPIAITITTSTTNTNTAISMKRRFASDDDEGDAVADVQPPASSDDDEGPDEVPARRHQQQQSDGEVSTSSSDDDDPPQQQHRSRRRQHGGSSGSGSEDDSDAAASDSSGDDDDGDDELDAQEQVLEQRLAEVPFEVLEALHQDGTGPSGAAARAAAVAAKQLVFHRENKNRPQEVSSKRPVSRFREVLQVPKQCVCCAGLGWLRAVMLSCTPADTPNAPPDTHPNHAQWRQGPSL